MATYISGPRIVLGAANDTITLNCPIKKIIMLSGPATNLIINGTYVFFNANGRELEFPNIKGYPGTVLKVPDTLASEVTFLIEEIGDVLNPNYFKEDIRNWNGHGASAVAEAAETEAPKKTVRAKKAEVTE